jgi:Zn-dependent peptidase ImmA (M78 family)/transcriptional regulator with XRE-family HTH domain
LISGNCGKGKMMPTYRVDVEPDVLVWARTSIGLSTEEAAARIGVSTITLMLWEAGAFSEAQPTLVQLRKMAEVYHRPLSAFYFPAPPSELPPKVPDFRLLTPGTSQAWSTQMHLTYRRVLMQQEVATELADSAGTPLQEIDIRLDTSIPTEEAAHTIRDWLGIHIGEQLSWGSKYRALNSWIGAAEGHDVLVAHSDGVSLDEMRGFAVSENPLPVIVLNGNDSPRGRIFTLIHELVHLTMRSGALCSMQEVRQPQPSTPDIETYCNRVAGAVLLPKDAVLRNLKEEGVTALVNWSDTDLQQWARRYQVSREVVLRRFVGLGYASLDQYFQKVREYNAQYQANRKKAEADRKRRKEAGLPPSRPNPIQIRVRNLGHRYTSDVLHAYSRRDINAGELSEYLETRVDNIPDVIAMLERRR